MLKIESVGSSAFLGTKSLTDIKIPGKIVDILPNAFQSSGLEKFDINASTIYSYAFKYSLLKEITLPVSVKSVGTEAFYCSALEKVTILNPDCNIDPSKSTFGDIKAKPVIYGYDYSTAQIFAMDNGLEFVSLGEAPEETTTTTTETTTTQPPAEKPALGDVNGDDIINAVDASRILVLYANINSGDVEVTEQDMAVCDINKDGMLNAVDASLVLAYYADLALKPELTLETFLEERK